MEFYVKALVWTALGLMLGFAAYFVFLQPHGAAPPAAIQNQPPPDEPAIPVPEAEAVNITMIEAPGCDQCNAEGLLLTETKAIILTSGFLKTGTSKAIKSDTPEAQALIAKYNITELPSIVIEGPVTLDAELVAGWRENVGSQEGENALVTRLGYPPYYDIANKTVVGLVTGMGITASGCLECGDPGLFIASLENPPIAMVFGNKTVYDENSSEAQALIAKYNITKVPVLFLSEADASAYPVFTQIKELGSVEDGWFILRDVVPPYLDLAANRTLRGLVKAKYLVNSSCTECFDISTLAEYISYSSGIVISEETAYEAGSPEGQALISAYNITAIPTLILSPDAKYYPHFESVWEGQNSTIEEDGWFVFRSHSLLASPDYQNISR